MRYDLYENPDIMKRYLFFFFTLLAAFSAVDAYSQAKKPTIMVMPSDEWCSANGYTTTFTSQGKTSQVTDYETAVRNNIDLGAVLAKIGEIMADRSFPVKDLAQTIKSAAGDELDAEMLTSSAGSAMAETPYERLTSKAKADIVVTVTWKVNTTGPKKSVTYYLKGLDAYTNKQIAGAEGTGAPSFSAEVPLLLEEATLDKMDGFLAQLMDHFNDMAQNGREVSINVRTWDNGSGINFETEYDGEELTDIIDNWMHDNTVNHRYNLSDASENVLRFEQVRIPLYDARDRAMDTRKFAGELRKFLQKQPYGITSKAIAKGLGRVDIILGEK